MPNTKLISVIIATFNNCNSLQDTLDCLLKQEIGEDFNYEVIVVDNNSSDHTQKTVNSFVVRFNGRLKYYFEPKSGKSNAINSAFKIATGDIIAFTDDDCLPQKDWLKSIWDAYYQNNDIDIILGNTFWEDGQPFYRSEDKLRGNGMNMSIKKNIIDEIGKFDEFLSTGTIGCAAEDVDFIYRAANKNKKILFINHIKVIHKLRTDKQEKNRKNYRDIKGYMIFCLKHAILRKDMFALKSIFWFFLDWKRDLVRSIRNKNKDRVKFRLLQLYGSIVGIVKGLYIWLLYFPLKNAHAKS